MTSNFAHASYMVGMQNINEEHLSRQSCNSHRVFANHVCLPDGGEIISFRVGFGFEHEFWRPGNVYLLARWWTNRNGTPIAGTVHPSFVGWDESENLVEVCFSPTEEQIIEHFADSNEPLVVRYSRVAGELRPRIHYGKDTLSGRIVWVHTHYFPSGKVQIVETYHLSKLLSYMEYDEAGNLIVEH